MAEDDPDIRPVDERLTELERWLAQVDTALLEALQRIQALEGKPKK